jgi:hypothetical protein
MWMERMRPGALQKTTKPEAHLNLDEEERNPGDHEKRRNGEKQRYTTVA